MIDVAASILGPLPTHAPGFVPVLLGFDLFSAPVLIGLGAVAALVLIAGLVWLLHVTAVGSARKELEKYKEQVVSLSEKIDALKERHKLLPHEDKDFAKPMAGETLAAYNQVATLLERHREEWLKLMNVWEEAQKILESERFMGIRRARDAKRRLKAAAAPAEFASLLRDCEEPLNLIEEAHEQVAAKLKSHAQEEQRLVAQLESLTAAGLQAAAYQPDRQAAQSLVEESKGFMPADPLAALRRLDQALGKMTQLNARAGKILEHSRACVEAAKRIEDTARNAYQRRSQGLLLKEPGADPDPPLAEAQRQHAQALAALNLADEAAAGAAVAKASSLADEAKTAIERHVAAKAKCESELQTRRNEAHRLVNLQAQAQSQRTELERDFAAETWLAVANFVHSAQGRLSSAQRISDEAARNCASNVQYFFQATRLLAEAAESHKQAESELVAVGKRLRELIEIRAKCQASLSQVRSVADRVSAFLRSSTADRVRANEQHRAAADALNRIIEESRLPRPDWARLAARLTEIQTDLERAEKLAKEDVQLAQQAASQIAQTDGVVNEARGYREHGFTADLTAADSQLAQARGKLAGQEYEEAIRLATAAEQAARAARNDAKARAQRRQQEIEAQRQADEAARAAKAATGLDLPAASLPAEAEPPTETSRLV